MSNRTNTNFRGAFGFALGRLAAVTWGGVVAVCLYLGLVVLGPVVEGRFFPVVTDYKISDLREEANHGISFIPTFRKVRDCGYYGVSWFAPDANGNLVRIQVAPMDRDPTAPQTGPMGKRAGDRMALYPPEGATDVLAVMSHDCGMIWQTRTQVGPFKVRTLSGKLISRIVRKPSTMFSLANK